MDSTNKLNSISSRARRLKAILILGPTGSGKTPLGKLMEKKGLNSQRCYHFDFGENLRLIAKSEKPDKRFTTGEISFINKVLASGALLENEHFYLAQKILNWFVKRNHVNLNSIIILNGLPRHIGQAKEVDSIMDITAVIYLASSPKVSLARIRRNSGGDRINRPDDDITSVRNKISIFNQRTSKLIEHYRSTGKEIITIEVKENTAAEDMLKALSNHL